MKKIGGENITINKKLRKLEKYIKNKPDNYFVSSPIHVLHYVQYKFFLSIKAAIYGCVDMEHY